MICPSYKLLLVDVLVRIRMILSRSQVVLEISQAVETFFLIYVMTEGTKSPC